MRDINPFRSKIVEPEVAIVNRNYPWMAGFNAIVDHHYFTKGEISLEQAVDEVDIFSCTSCSENNSGHGNDMISSGCQDSWDVIALKNFGGKEYASSNYVQPFMRGVAAATNVLKFATEESHV